MSMRNRSHSNKNERKGKISGKERAEGQIVLNEKKKFVSRYRPEDNKVRRLVEPKPLCCICNEVIDFIPSAIFEGNNQYSHFDCVIHKLNSRFNVMPPDKISYIGQGSFAIMGIKNEGGYYIKQRIPYESQDQFKDMRSFVDSNMI